VIDISSGQRLSASSRPPLASCDAEALERAQGHIFLIAGSSRSPFQLAACQVDHALKVHLPQLLRSGGIARFELIDPESDGLGGRHAGLF
jgi:hypothetical protein